MPTRRKALRAVAQAAAGLAFLPLARGRAEAAVVVNDIHSQLNPTRVDRVVAVDSEATLRAASAFDAVDGAHSEASRCHRVVASKRTT